MQFSFGGDTGMTYEEMLQARKFAETARGQFQKPQNVGEGWGSILANVGAGLVARDADKAYEKGRGGFKEEQRSVFADLLGQRLGGGPNMSSMGGGQAPREVRNAAMEAHGGPTNAAATAVNDPNSWEAIRAGIFAGESGGDYDALFGYSNRNGPFAGMRPSEMTVGDVLKFQDPQGEYGQWVKGQVGSVATPVGAYQVVGTTLRDAVKNGVVDPNEKFDQATQDRVGKWVLSTQGTGAWEGYRGPQAGGGAPTGGAIPGGPDPRILELMQNPYATDAERSALGILLQQQMAASQPPDPMQAIQMEKAALELEQMRNPQRKTTVVDGRLVDAQTGEVIYEPDPNAPGGGTEYGLNPQYGVDDQGNPVLIQIGKNGEAVQTRLPEGVSLSKEADRIDAGTHWVLLDPITRQPVGQIPKELAEAESEKARGKVEGTAAAEATLGLGSAVSAGQESIALIDSIINDPALPSITGMVQGRIPPIGQGGTDLNAKIEQLKGKAFLEAFESLKGAGQITEREGAAATAAMARLDRAQSTEAYMEALTELRGIMARGIERAQSRAGVEPTGQPAPTASSGQPATANAPSPPNAFLSNPGVADFAKAKGMTVEELWQDLGDEGRSAWQR